MSTFLNREIESVSKIGPDKFEVRAEGMVVETDGSRLDYCTNRKTFGFNNLRYETEYDRKRREREEGNAITV